MNDFLQHIVARFGDAEPASRPRLPSLFEPLGTGYAAPKRASFDAVFDQTDSSEADFAPGDAHLDSKLSAVSKERIDGETAARATRPIPPLVPESLVTESTVSEPLVREPEATAPPEIRVSAPATVSDVQALSPQPTTGPEQLPAAKPISQVRQEEQALATPIKTTPSRQTSEPPFATSRRSPQRTTPPPPQPAEAAASPTPTPAETETQSPALSRPQTQIELPPAPGEHEFTLPPAAVEPHDTQSPLRATRPLGVVPVDDRVPELAANSIVDATEPDQTSLLTPFLQSSALKPPSPEAPRFDRLPQQSPPASSPATINVTIGRVEVTATPPPATPRRTRNTAPVMTLESYLRQSAAGGGG